MSIQVGNASAPRWFDMSLRRLDEYVEFVQECGATSTELVLHVGPADDRIARVHVLEDDWKPVFERFHARGIVCHVHAPLEPRLNLSRWLLDPTSLQQDFASIVGALSSFAECQGQATTLIVHAASGTGDGEFATRQAIEWLLDECERSSSRIRIAIELRRSIDQDDRRFDRQRDSLTDFVHSFDRTNLGICWDLVNDIQLHEQGGALDHDQRESFLRLVSHVHLHDIGESLSDGHHPLSNENLAWRPALRQLLDTGFDGAITLEVRYRHALAQGDPWTVLADSYNRLLSFLRSESTTRNSPSIGSR